MGGMAVCGGSFVAMTIWGLGKFSAFFGEIISIRSGLI
jgi:hypothetical protein